MGRTVTPKYAVEVKHGLTIQSTPSAWKGKPTAERLAKWVSDYNESLKPGGANEHLTKQWPIEACRITSARIILNDGSRTSVVFMSYLHDVSTGRPTGKAEEEYLAAQTRLADRIVNDRTTAKVSVQQVIDALEEHKNERRGEYMEGVYQMFINALRYRREEPSNGKLTVVLELNNLEQR